MTRACGCPPLVGRVTDAERHTQWHQEILPLARGDYLTIWEAYGLSIPPQRTYIDEQFDAARRQHG